MIKKYSKAFALAGAIAFSFLLTMFIIRIVEIYIITHNHYFSNPFFLFLRGLSIDFLLAVVVFLFLIILPLHKLWLRNLALVFLGSIAVFHLISGYYFAITLTILDHTLFQFTVGELINIIRTFGVFHWYYILIPLPFLLIFLLFFALNKYRKASTLVLFSTIPIFLIFSFLPNSQIEEDSADDLASKNKFAAFIADSFQNISNSYKDSQNDNYTALVDYPLLHKDSEENSLGAFFNLKETPPNIVFVIVESLSKAYSGTNADEISFTPFLDSLESASLYFENFLATAERTFGVLPSSLASLPHGEKGFTMMKNNIPNHHSLPKILFENGYYGAFYYGGDAQFDYMKMYMEHNGFEYIFDHGEFDYSETDYKTSIDPVPFGINDKINFQNAAKSWDSLPTNPYLHVYLTLSMHYPFIIEEQESYIQKVKKIINAELKNKHEQEKYLKYLNVFSTSLYTDDAIRNLISDYQKTDDFDNTIFFIYGDHRFGPTPVRDKIDKYRVPLLIYSPLLKKQQKIKAVNTHLDITPSILGLLEEKYDFNSPDKVHWLGESFDTSKTFQSDRTLNFMLNSRDVEDFLDKDIYLSKNKIYQITEGLNLIPLDDPELLEEKTRKKRDLQNLHKHVVLRNSIIPEKNELFVLNTSKQGAVNFNQTEEYVILLEQELENKHDKLVLELSGEIAYPTDSLTDYPLLVISISSPNEGSKYWEKFEYRNLFPDTTENNIIFNQNIHSNSEFQLEKAAVLKVYFWNNTPSNRKFNIENFSLNLKAVKP